MSFIELESASFTWPGSSLPAVADLNLRVDEGDYVAIVGHNGSGKSSLLRLLNGLRRADRGSVRVAGLDAGDPSNARAVRSSLVLVFQSPPDQIVSTVVEEDVAFGPENLGLDRAEIGRRVDEALTVVGLEAERRSPSHFLSAGQQQRLAVAGALAMRPRCIAFDEATAMLDPPSRAAILDLMDSLNGQGVTIIHVTHDMAEASRSRRVIMMHEGRLTFDGTPAALVAALREPARGPLGLKALVAPEGPRIAWALHMPEKAGEGATELAGRLRAAMEDGRIRPSSGEAQRGAAEPLSRLETPQDEAPLLSLQKVDYSYLRGTTNERPAVRDLSLAIPRGSLVALVGMTGSGKSSILQLMDGLAFPVSGTVIAFGKDTASKATDLRRLRTRAPLSIQRPESAIFEVYSGDDVAFGPKNLGIHGSALVERVREAMDRVGLPFAEFRDRRTRALSGGERRRVALAGILALDPEAVLLDEPTSSLDPAAKDHVMGIVKSLVEAGKTLVMATHSMEEAAMADRVAVVSAGRLVAQGTPIDIFYRHFDPAWGIGRPFVCEVASTLGIAEELGWPMTAEGLAAAFAVLDREAALR